MGVPTVAQAERRHRTIAFVLGVLGAAFGLGIGHLVGNVFAYGYKLDWFRFVAPDRFYAEDAGIVATLVAVVVALIMVPLSVSIVQRDWDRRRPALPAPRGPRRTRRAHKTALAIVFGLLLPVILGFAAFLLLFSSSSDGGATRMDFRDAIVRVAVIAGFLSGFVPPLLTGSLLRRNRLVEDRPGENVFARIALFAGRFAWVTIVLLVATTLFLGSGIQRLDTNVDVADVLPRGDPNTAAAHNLTTKFKSTFTQQVTFQLRIAGEQQYNEDAAKLPYRQTRPTPKNISDEVYVRAIDELLEFVKAYRDPITNEASPFVSSVALPDFYRIINWTMAGGRDAPPASFSLPPASDQANSRRYALVHEGVWRAIPGTADAVISPSGEQTAALVTVSSESTLSGKEIGEWALRIRKAYIDWAETNDEAYHVFTGANTPKFSVDLPIANAHSSELAGHDFRKLLPIIAVWLVVTVFLAFRSVSAIGIALSALVLSVVWTFGLMGFMGIPLNTLNLTVIPLIMGVGIDYGIHTLNEYKENRSRGLSTQETFRNLGARGFLALYVATLNTIVGLAVMIASPSLLIAELGILACIAIASSFLITITWIPAVLSILPEARAHEYRPSPMMAAIARTVSRYRLIVVPAMVVISLFAILSGFQVKTEPFGDPPRNWLASDPLRQEHEDAIEGFYDSPTDDIKANILIFEGDANDPQAHAYMDAIERSLRARGEGRSTTCTTPDQDRAKGRVIVDTLRSLPFFVRTYLTVRDGVPGAGSYLGIQALADRFQNFEQYDTYPRTREQMSALLDEVQETPLRGLGQLFYDHPEDGMAMMLFSVRAASYEDAREVWWQVMGNGPDRGSDADDGSSCIGVVLENEHLRPESMHVSFFGNTAINYLFVAKELPWVGYMSIVDNILVMAFVYLPTRLLRPTLVVGLLNLLTGMWWVGVLPFIDVGWAITLTLPLVFIYAIGSDYGLHLVLGAIHSGSTEDTFRTTGKGILFSGVTTFGAFLIYTQMSNLAVQRTMIATAAAIPIIFLVTMLVVPTLYPVGRRIKGPSHGEGAHVVPEPAIPGAPISSPTRVTTDEPAPPAGPVPEPPQPETTAYETEPSESFLDKFESAQGARKPRPKRRKRDR